MLKVETTVVARNIKLKDVSLKAARMPITNIVIILFKKLLTAVPTNAVVKVFTFSELQ